MGVRLMGTYVSRMVTANKWGEVLNEMVREGGGKDVIVGDLNVRHT